MDREPMYKIDSLIKNKELYDTELKFIPTGMTNILQPLDAIVNKPFKDLIRKKYVEYSFFMNCDNEKASYEKILDLIADILWNEEQITSSMIKNKL